LFDSQAHPSDQPCLYELCSSEAAQDTVRSHVDEVRGSNLRHWFITKGAAQIHPHLPDWSFISLQNSTFNIQGAGAVRVVSNLCGITIIFVIIKGGHFPAAYCEKQ